MTAAGSSCHLGVVVVNYGSSALLHRNLAGVDRSSLEPCTVVVVDNPTSADERQRVRDLAAASGWELVEPDCNLGFGGGANVGVERAVSAGADVVALVNPDVSFRAPTLRRLAATAAESPLTLVAPRIHRPDGSLWFAGAVLDPSTGFTRSEPDHGGDRAGRWITGACVALHLRAWAAVSGFDERFFLYWEDVDLAHRLVAAGGDLVVRHDLTVTHDVGATQAGAGKSTTYAYYNCRNRLLFATAHVGRWRRVAWLLRSPRYAIRVLTRDGRRAALRRPDLVVAAARGTAAGAIAVLRSVVRGRSGQPAAAPTTSATSAR